MSDFCSIDKSGAIWNVSCAGWEDIYFHVFFIFCINICIYIFVYTLGIQSPSENGNGT